MKLYKRIYDKIFVNYPRIKDEVSEVVCSKIDTTMANDNYFLEKCYDSVRQFDYFNTELLTVLEKSNKKKILLVGFYGAPNLGDELMLETLFQYFDFEKVDVTVMLADNPDYNSSWFPKVKIIHYPKTQSDFNILAQAFDAVVFGGGAIIDDKHYENKKSYRGDLGTIILDLSDRFIVWKKEIYVLGVSSNDKFLSDEYIERLSNVIKNSTYFSVRDKNSYDIINKYCKGINSKSIKIVSDIVFANKNLVEFSNKSNEIKEIGIVWITSDDNIDSLKTLISLLKDNYKIHLIPFYGYVDFDVNNYSELISLMDDNSNIVLEKLARNMNQLVEVFKKCDFLISMRYHGVLVANLLNLPNLSICYDNHPHYMNKMDYLNKIFGVDNMLLASDLDLNNICKSMKSLYRVKKEVDLVKMKKNACEELNKIIEKISLK
ncbi:MAG: polysaccharide pyruvyl transferase family protein [Bacilli bacterium]|nr:polysaccharide pyruvyl transferase family protein [Bacilli bacterium]